MRSLEHRDELGFDPRQVCLHLHPADSKWAAHALCLWGQRLAGRSRDPPRKLNALYPQPASPAGACPTQVSGHPPLLCLAGVHPAGFLTASWTTHSSASSRVGLCRTASAMGNEELWTQPALEMPKRRDVLAIVLIVLPWTLLVTVWHQSTIAPLLAAHKDDGSDSRREVPPGTDPREYCMSDRDIVEVVRTEYVYTRPPPWSDTLPTIHVVTPTYSRPVQKAELTRMANTLLHVPNLHWLVVEDAPRRTPLTARLLRDTGLNYTHLHVETPRNYKLRGDARDPRIPRGTMQRNLALRWLRETFPRNSSQPGVVYFADDDNTYSLELFEEMRSTRRVSVWPVAFVGGLRYEAPRVNGAGKVVGWKTVFDPHRPFAIDMAGFAVNLRLILQRSQAYFKLRGVKGGYQESSLLRELVTLNDLEPKAANCTKILVWHTRTEKPVLVNEGKKGFTDPTVEI
ncbi:galactosylgalactosylxylosylprotein 3-beta-glucuronosyltransferase 1 isoform X1 [Camelus dromedarius]|uniref:Galactosylgalactosylxylosylprotein 3-beta-glucuronosyltransferase n=2 Tax=Camelus ferus TaxID=419612 RepID=A0A8B8SDB3_CAMFR|nr:galactosylgalactosylxylosylprotein 3-beta-glucuronosyltransferase 1 isoform X1 [Camelus dromedarius]XP_031299196.1 galactosylgalactosylxylosylprotein 3-beta-glucuronosyltransferase 1 isoform X1 [Camelus dromedarius]XP_032328221.1 galactosylgalactosylxylosylprotein 3-beta-glucuronosyltransferase 1 isoform X1 [Camelus ferus]XP_032328222.1 galactosylgalactosylxylosylprotein 3-beta-glucuronosyltransferase 1 isoform X1 [Camelus ferus]